MMRKSRFLINLIATTAIGLSVIGCGESSSTGAIRDTSDISVPNNNGPNRNLREYLLVGQRGLEVPSAEFNAGQSLPTVPSTRETGVTPQDRVGIDAGLLYELLGIASVPVPDLQFTAPGGSGLDPAVTPSNDTTGFHQMYPSPSGQYVIGLARAKDNIPSLDGAVSRIEVFKIDVPPTDVVFPPKPSFGTPAAAGGTIFDYSVDQGEFVSGAWSRSGNNFYYSMNERIYKTSFLEGNGALTISPTGGVLFPVGATAMNNAVQMIASPDGGFLFALDNDNGSIITYSIDPANGDLTEVSTLSTVADPRGFALDRTGNFLYVAGRSSQQLAGYRLGSGGALAPIELFPSLGLGAIPFTYTQPLGDVAASPVADQLFLGAYNGTISGFTIDGATGALVDGGSPVGPLNSARNLANLEVEPSGRFVISAFEHDFDTFQNFVTPANGFRTDESNVFANTDSATNPTIPLVASRQFDKNGRVAYVFPTTLDRAFSGSVQSFRIGAGANVTVERAVEVENPYGLGFLQLIFAPPASTEPVVP